MKIAPQNHVVFRSKPLDKRSIEIHAYFNNSLINEMYLVSSAGKLILKTLNQIGLFMKACKGYLIHISLRLASVFYCFQSAEKICVIP